jgi:succinoglycan biosynthesis protein ExoU
LTEAARPTSPASDKLDPEICVVIAAWNAEGTLERALRSVFAQTGVSVEAVVVDDASTDGTLALARSMARGETRLKVLAQTRNRGPAAARNHGLDASRAPWVTVLDSDDAMEPGRLAGLLVIAREGAWDIVADDLWKVASFEPGAPRQRLWSPEPIGRREIDFSAFVRGNLSRLHGGRGEMGFLKPLMRRAFLDAHALRYDETMRLGEDYALYATALARGARFCLTDPLGYEALVRPGSLSGQHRAADLAALVAADRRLRREPALRSADRRLLRDHEIETQKRWLWLRLIEAVRARDLAEAARCFAAPPEVVAHLLGNLGEQVVLRSRARLRGSRGPASRDGEA